MNIVRRTGSATASEHIRSANIVPDPLSFLKQDTL